MRAPAFWWDESPGLLARALSPIGGIWGSIAAARGRRIGVDVGVPVFCVGNFVAGGAGKTPVAIEVARVARAMGLRPAILTRGYGGRRNSAPVALLNGEGDAAIVGDEAPLLARAAPTYVCADRLAAARRAADDGADLLVMDDGLQNPALRKRVSIGVIDAERGCGNGLCLPAGPLRAPLREQWRSVTAIVVMGDGARGKRALEDAAARGIPALRASLEPDPSDMARLSGKRLLAFAGIGHPAKFFGMLRSRGALLAAVREFPDHHAYDARDVERLVQEAAARDAVLVTTEKDAVKLPKDVGIDVVRVAARFRDTGRLEDLIASAGAGRPL